MMPEPVLASVLARTKVYRPVTPPPRKPRRATAKTTIATARPTNRRRACATMGWRAVTTTASAISANILQSLAIVMTAALAPAAIPASACNARELQSPVTTKIPVQRIVATHRAVAPSRSTLRPPAMTATFVRWATRATARSVCRARPPFAMTAILAQTTAARASSAAFLLQIKALAMTASTAP